MYSEQEFSAAIDLLYEFGGMVRARAEQMRSEAENCVANMEEDTVAKNASGNLISVIDRIEKILDGDLRRLLDQLEEERERAARIAQDDE